MKTTGILPRARRAAIAIGGAASLALLGCGPSVIWAGKSPDRAREVAISRGRDGQRVRVDGRDGPAFLGIGLQALAFSPDGRRLAYPARVPDGWVVVVMEGPKVVATSAVHDGIGEIVWSADGRRHAYAAERKGRWLVVVDGREGPTFEALRARSLKLSAGGSHFVYAADEDGKVVVVADGVKSAAYDGVGHLTLGPGGQPAFVARKRLGAVVVAGGEESATYEDVAELSLSPSGRRLAWTARRNGRWHVVEGGSESEPYDRVSALVWAPRTEALAYAAGRAGEERVVAAGAHGATFEHISPGSLTFDAAGTTVAYAGLRAGAWRVVTGRDESPPYSEVEAPLFVGESTAVAHLARRGAATFLVVDGHAGPVHAGASGLVLSAGGRRFLHTARAGAQAEVVEGVVRGAPCGGGRCTPAVTRTTRHDLVVAGTLVWSASGAHSGYLAGEAQGAGLFLVVDGARAGAVDPGDLLASLVATPDPAGVLGADSMWLSDWVRAELALVDRRPGATAGGAAQERARR